MIQRRILQHVYAFILFTLAMSASAHEGADNPWLTHQDLGDGITMINDNNLDNIYMVEGSERVLVIDTGIGHKNLMEYVSKLTDKPLVVVNSHAHPDHAGGNRAFDKVYIHEQDRDAHDFYTSVLFMQNTYRNFVRQVMPEHVREEIRNRKTELVTIAEGFTFDLGNRQLEVIHLPGHTQGSIALLDSKTHYLFSGDSTTTHVWVQLQDSTDVAGYRKTLDKLLARKHEFKRLMPAHDQPTDTDRINKLAAAADKVLAGECEPSAYQYSPVKPVAACIHDGVTLVYHPDRIDLAASKLSQN